MRTHVFTVFILICLTVVAAAQSIKIHDMGERARTCYLTIESGADGMNVAVIEGRFGLVLINTSPDPFTMDIVRGLIEQKYEVPIEQVINTSAAKHNVGGNLRFAETIILAHEAARDAMRVHIADTESALAALDAEIARLEASAGDSSTAEQIDKLRKRRQKLQFLAPRLPTRTIDAGTTIPYPGATYKLLPVPGTTAGDLIVLYPEKRTIITGDLIRDQAIPMWYPELGGSFTQLLEATRRILAYSDVYETIIPGRGSHRTFRIVEEQRAFLLTLQADIHQARENGRSLEETIQSLDYEIYKTWKGYDEYLPVVVRQLWVELEGM